MSVVKSDAYDDIERFKCFMHSLILPYLNGMIEEDAVHGLPTSIPLKEKEKLESPPLTRAPGNVFYKSVSVGKDGIEIQVIY